jgi:hypothetical protein
VVEFDSLINPAKPRKVKGKDGAALFYQFFQLSVIPGRPTSRHGNVDVHRIRESEVVADTTLPSSYTYRGSKPVSSPWASRGLRHVTRRKKDKVMAMLYVEPKPKT